MYFNLKILIFPHYVKFQISLFGIRGKPQNEQNCFRSLSIRKERMNFIHKNQDSVLSILGILKPQVMNREINSLAQWKNGSRILIKVSYNWHNVLMEHFFQNLCFLLLHWSRWLFLPTHRFSIAIINMCLSVPGKKKQKNKKPYVELWEVREIGR